MMERPTAGNEMAGSIRTLDEDVDGTKDANRDAKKRKVLDQENPSDSSLMNKVTGSGTNAQTGSATGNLAAAASISHLLNDGVAVPPSGATQMPQSQPVAGQVPETTQVPAAPVAPFAAPTTDFSGAAASYLFSQIPVIPPNGTENSLPQQQQQHQQQQQQPTQNVPGVPLGSFVNPMAMQQALFPAQPLADQQRVPLMQSQQMMQQMQQMQQMIPQQLLHGIPQPNQLGSVGHQLQQQPTSSLLSTPHQQQQQQQLGGQQLQQQQLQFPLAMQLNPQMQMQPGMTAASGVVGAPQMVVSKQTGRKPVVLHQECDAKHLTDYQVLARKYIELFEASTADKDKKAQGRNRPIVLGQVGIRCVCCAQNPPNSRSLGAVYFPSRLEGIYQSAQNMVSKHLMQCKHAPETVRKQLADLKNQKGAAGGGKRYWADSARALGVYEGERALYFVPENGAQVGS